MCEEADSRCRRRICFSCLRRCSRGWRAGRLKRYYSCATRWRTWPGRLKVLVESPAGRPLNQFEAYLEQKRRREQEAHPPPTTTSGTLRYRLSTEVPDYWIPLMLVRVGQGLRLQRGAVLKTDGSQE